MTRMTFNLLLFILMSALTNYIYAADWSFGGETKNAKGNTEFLFIDRNAITSTDNATIRFWLKSISEKNINRYIKQHEKESVQEGAKRLMQGYSPDVLLLDRYKKLFKNGEELENARFDIISKETAANSDAVTESSKIYFEMDCKYKRIHYLDGYTKNDKGIIISGSLMHESEWGYITPESNSEDWASILCK